MTTKLKDIITNRDVIILVFMLEMLHFSLWIEFGSWLSLSLLLVHLGLFLIWQPVWRGDEQISWGNSVLFILLTLIFVSFINWALMFAWLITLCGFAGGTVIINQRARTTYMLVLSFLACELIVICTPNLFDIVIDPATNDFFRIGLPILPLVLIGLPEQFKNTSRLNTVDLLHAMMTSMLMSLIIFGSLLYMFITGTEYIISLAQTLVGLAVFLLLISWLLSPRAGFSGLSQLWSKSLLNIGTPFEQWLSGLADVSQKHRNPDDFLEAAVVDLASLNWIEGVNWKTRDSASEVGTITRNSFEYNSEELNIFLYANTPVSGALYLHCNLLVKLLEDFYIAKLREQTLSAQAHIQAVHETGARVTHDIKNLLQSLKAITEIVSNEYTDTDRRNTSKLLERQLPHLTQRLQLSLDKLQAPQDPEIVFSSVSHWWSEFIKRNESEHIQFTCNSYEDRDIPVELFDTVSENILENLREKGRIDQDLKIDVNLIVGEDDIQLLFTDNGDMIPEEIVGRLLKAPVNSANGLGIGLYQASQLANSLAYKLSIESNTNGKVKFALSQISSS